MSIRGFVLSVMVCVLPAASLALDLPKTAKQLSDRATALGSYGLPLGPFENGSVPAQNAEGRIDRRSWRIDGGVATTLQLLAPLRAQLVADGYDIVFECREHDCGGFDFRFGTEVIPAPDMYVDLSDYRFLSARRGEDEVLSLLVSRSKASAYIQMIQVIPQGETRRQIETTAKVPVSAEASDLIGQLAQTGRVVLEDLDFPSGANDLQNDPYASLQALANYLSDNPDTRVLIVGHTDSVGSLSGNVALSKARAEAVRQRLISAYQVPPDRVQAEGVGFLAPRVSHLTEEGRTANRRVEAILLPK
jgi:OOP family OmpA-OmpF porin